MWFKLFRAEIYKIIGHRWATGCMMWIFPLGVIGITLLLLLVVGLSSEARAGIGEDNPQWTSAMINIWDFPNNPLGRMLLLGFTAVLFGGEYQWNTWKSTVPRTWRISLIVVKFTAVAVFVVAVFMLTSVLWAGGQGLAILAAGHDYGPTVTQEVLADFAHDYALQIATTFISVIISAGYAALAAMLTRSILGSVLVGFIVTTVEGFSIVGFGLAAWLLNMESIQILYRYTPTYNLLNLTSWINEKASLDFKLPSGKAITTSLEGSLLILGIWVVGLIALTAYRFQKQDIVN